MLTELKVRNVKPTAKPQKLFDGGGLHLHVAPAPSGRKTWRIAYRWAGKQQTYVIGAYPEVTVSDAREAAREHRTVLESGRNPQAVKVEARVKVVESDQRTLKWLAEEWIGTQAHAWSEDYQTDVRRALELHVFPKLQNRPIAGVTPMDLIEVMRPVATQGKRFETVRRLCQRLNGMFTMAYHRGLITQNPAAHLYREFPSPSVQHLAAVDEAELPALFTAMAHDRNRLNEMGVWLLALTALRTGELRQGEWAEVNWEDRVWLVPASRMKRRKTGLDHPVPLSTQALAVLTQLRRVTGSGRLMFPSRTDREQPISENTLLFTLYRIGYRGRMTGHGFRSIFSTVANEHEMNTDHIEAVLDHVEASSSRRPYNRARYIEGRRVLLQWWGDRLDEMTGGRCHRIIP